MIVAIGGERYPERSAAVGGSLTGMAVIGSIVYPPAMGFLSVTVGLPVAMLGNALLAIACACRARRPSAARRAALRRATRNCARVGSRPDRSGLGGRSGAR